MTFDEVMASFKELSLTDDPTPLFEAYADHLVWADRPWAWFAQFKCNRNVYEFDGRYIGVQFNESFGDNPPVDWGTRAFECEKSPAGYYLEIVGT